MSGRDTVLPYFGSKWVRNNFLRRIFWSSHFKRTLRLSHVVLLCVSKHFFSGDAGIWMKWRQSDCFLCPVSSRCLFHLLPHLCEYEQMTQTERCHYKAILRGLLHRLTGRAALCLLAWLPLSSSSPLFFLQFSFEQRPSEDTTLCWIVRWGNTTRWCLLSPDRLITF